MREVMIKAWEIAREGQERFGGKVKEYFAKSLKIAWSLVKNKSKELTTWVEEIKDAFLEEMITVQANIWEKYGIRRIYINGGYGLDAGYFDFDDNGKFVKAWSEYSDWDNGRTTAHFKVIRNLIEKGVW